MYACLCVCLCTNIHAEWDYVVTEILEKWVLFAEENMAECVLVLILCMRLFVYVCVHIYTYYGYGKCEKGDTNMQSLEAYIHTYIHTCRHSMQTQSTQTNFWRELEECGNLCDKPATIFMWNKKVRNLSLETGKILCAGMFVPKSRVCVHAYIHACIQENRNKKVRNLSPETGKILCAVMCV